jgi:hypothetical protein
MERDLLEAALRVLNGCTFGNPADAADVTRLRESVVGRERDLAPDLLATRIIEREIEFGRASRRAAGQ